MVALELAHRTEQIEGYRENLRDSNKSLKKLLMVNSTLLKRVSELRSELSALQIQKTQMEQEVQRLSLELQGAEHKGLLEGMTGCRDQILLTPVGQEFLHTLNEGLISDLCKTPHFLCAFGDDITSLLDAGQKFALNKLLAEDLTPDEDIKNR